MRSHLQVGEVTSSVLNLLFSGRCKAAALNRNPLLLHAKLFELPRYASKAPRLRVRHFEDEYPSIRKTWNKTYSLMSECAMDFSEIFTTMVALWWVRGNWLAHSLAWKSRTELHRALHWVVGQAKERLLGVSAVFKSDKTHFELAALDLSWWRQICCY